LHWLLRLGVHPVHALALHTFEALAVAGLHNLALLTLLGILKVSLVAQLHEVATLVNLALEATEGALDGLALADVHLDRDTEGCGGGVAYWLGRKWIRSREKYYQT